MSSKLTELWQTAPRVVGKGEYQGEFGYAVSLLSDEEGEIFVRVYWDDGGEDCVPLSTVQNADRILERRF